MLSSFLVPLKMPVLYKKRSSVGIKTSKKKRSLWINPIFLTITVENSTVNSMDASKQKPKRLPKKETGISEEPVSCFFFWGPMRNIGELVRTGAFDLYLTRPVGLFVYLVLQQFPYTFFPRLIFSIGFWIYSMKKLQLQWTWQQTGFYGISLVSGFVIFSAITVITGAVSFWTIKSEEIVSLLTDNNYGLKNYCDYPIQIYGKGVQLLLTFVIPYAFTGYYPIAKLLENELGTSQDVML